MGETRTRRALVAAALVALIGGALLHWSRQRGDSQAEVSPGVPGAPGHSANASGALSAIQTNPVKRALRHSSWEIVSRAGGAAASAALSPDPAAGNSDRPGESTPSTEASPWGFGAPRAKFSLDFVRANFDAAGMRGVRRFAAFSPPQFEAIKKGIEARADTEFTSAADEFAAPGETVGFDLRNAADGREFSIDLQPSVGADGQSVRLRTVTRGTKIRRDGNLPIWDGQTVMILLDDEASEDDRRQVAAFVTVRLVGGDGDPVNEFVVRR